MLVLFLKTQKHNHKRKTKNRIDEWKRNNTFLNGVKPQNTPGIFDAKMRERAVAGVAGLSTASSDVYFLGKARNLKRSVAWW